MRIPCIDCTLKHLGNAAVLAEEVLSGYPDYDIYVYGHLDQASQEVRALCPELAEVIRGHRVKYQENHNHFIPYESLASATKMLNGLERKEQEVLLQTVDKELYAAITKGLDLSPDGRFEPYFDTRPVFIK